MIGRFLHRLAERCRPRSRQPAEPRTDWTTDAASLAVRLKAMRDDCSQCGACAVNCAFLTNRGLPGALATRYDFTDPDQQRIAYQCSLCGLCAALCPEGLDPCGLFLAIRRRHVEAGCFNPRPYRPLLVYERLGSSALFSSHSIPRGCTTVFFPGCALPGTRPSVTLQTYQRLRRAMPSLGLVLDCCAKPSHDLGRTACFHDRFDALLDRLERRGVHTVLTACPNCTMIFRQYGRGLNVRTVYEALRLNGVPADLHGAVAAEISVHDPCPLRNDSQTQTAVRGLLTDLGYAVAEMRHCKNFTVCCGEGGGVGFAEPRLAAEWTGLRLREAGSRRMATYCAGCCAALSRTTPTVHILDLLFRPEPARNNALTVARPPMTYVNRLLLKLRVKRIVRDAL